MAIPDYIFKHALESDLLKDSPRARNLLKETREVSAKERNKRGSASVVSAGFVDHLVYDAANTTKIPDKPVAINENNSSKDAQVSHLLMQAKKIDLANTEILGRNGWGDKFTDHCCIAHYAKNMDNAFFDGEKFNFGDGSGTIFTPLAFSCGVHAHEYGHGFVQTTSNSRYFGESGALNEATADWFGITIENFLLGRKINEILWLIGHDCLAENVKQQGWKALRTFTTEKAYPQDPQPKFLKDKKLGMTEINDNFGVHIWSGILNHAFYQYAVRQQEHEYLHEGLFQVFVNATAACGSLSGFQKFTDAVQAECKKREPKTLSALVESLKVVGLVKNV